MYHVMSSYLGKREDVAVLEKDGKFYLCTDWIRGEQRIWCEMRPGHAEEVMKDKGTVRHIPPLEIEKPEDWPEAVRRAMEQGETTGCPA